MNNQFKLEDRITCSLRFVFLSFRRSLEFAAVLTFALLLCTLIFVSLVNVCMSDSSAFCLCISFSVFACLSLCLPLYVYVCLSLYVSISVPLSLCLYLSIPLLSFSLALCQYISLILSLSLPHFLSPPPPLSHSGLVSMYLPDFLCLDPPIPLSNLLSCACITVSHCCFLCSLPTFLFFFYTVVKNKSCAYAYNVISKPFSPLKDITNSWQSFCIFFLPLSSFFKLNQIIIVFI